MKVLYSDNVLQLVERLPSPLPRGAIVKHDTVYGGWHRKDRRANGSIRWTPIPSNHLPKPMKLQALLLGVRL